MVGLSLFLFFTFLSFIYFSFFSYSHSLLFFNKISRLTFIAVVLSDHCLRLSPEFYDTIHIIHSFKVLSIMATIFGKSFLVAVSNSQFNPSEWKPFGEKYSLKEVWDVTSPGSYEQIAGDTAEVTATEFADGGIGLRISVPFKDGSTVELKLSGRSELEEGDKVKIDSITCQELHKLGNDPIVRYDGEKAN